MKFSMLLNFSEKKTARVFYTDPNLSIDPMCYFYLKLLINILTFSRGLCIMV